MLNRTLSKRLGKKFLSIHEVTIIAIELQKGIFLKKTVLAERFYKFHQ